MEHTHKIEQGDKIVFGDLAQGELSNSSFEVTNISTYDFKDKRGTEFILVGNGVKLRLRIKKRDGKKYLFISKKLNEQEVGQAFVRENIAEVMSGKTDVKLKSNSNIPANLKPWVASEYKLDTSVQQGYFYDKDYRDGNVSIHDEGLRQLDHYFVKAVNEEKSLDIEIYNQEQTDIYATVFFKQDDSPVKEYYSANSQDAVTEKFAF